MILVFDLQDQGHIEFSMVDYVGACVKTKAEMYIEPQTLTTKISPKFYINYTSRQHALTEFRLPSNCQTLVVVLDSLYFGK